MSPGPVLCLYWACLGMVWGRPGGWFGDGLSITNASSACRVSTVTSVISVTSVTSVPCVMVCAREYCGLQVMVGNYHRRGDEDLSLGKSCPSGLGRTPWSLWSRTGPRHVLVVSWWSAVGGRWKICLEANRRARLGGA